jgi:phosphoribosylformylglycinamidine synthase I
MKVRACVLFAAGTNCDRETARALELAGAEADVIHVNQLLERKVQLDRYQLLVLAGGFSYGDYVASGRILAVEVQHSLRDEITRFRDSGRLVLGICNGFQVLVKSGLLPAFDGQFGAQSVTLDANDSGRYEDRWVRLAVDDSPCVFTRGLDGTIELPVAHAEGKFVASDAPTLARLRTDRQIVLRYVADDGDPARYPDNPNGSELGIAGICDPTGRIFGLMPHPERFTRREHHPRWHRGRVTPAPGTAIFTNAVKYIQAN